MIFNLVPLFLANVLKAGTAAIGLIDGLAETTASLMKIYSGALSDRLGTRKWITVAGYALSACAKPFLYFANAWGWVRTALMKHAAALLSACIAPEIRREHSSASWAPPPWSG